MNTKVLILLAVVTVSLSVANPALRLKRDAEEPEIVQSTAEAGADSPAVFPESPEQEGSGDAEENHEHHEEASGEEPVISKSDDPAAEETQTEESKPEEPAESTPLSSEASEEKSVESATVIEPKADVVAANGAPSASEAPVSSSTTVSTSILALIAALIFVL